MPRLLPLLPLLALSACAAEPDLGVHEPGVVTVLDERGLSDLVAGSDDSPLVLNLFATWCSACRGELPVLDRFAAQDPSLRFAALSLDETGTTDAVRDYAATLDLGLPVYHLSVPDPIDAVERHVDAFRGAIPVTVVLGAEGRGLAVHYGRADREDLADLVAEARAAALLDGE